MWRYLYRFTSKRWHNEDVCADFTVCAIVVRPRIGNPSAVGRDPRPEASWRDQPVAARLWDPVLQVYPIHPFRIAIGTKQDKRPVRRKCRLDLANSSLVARTAAVLLSSCASQIRNKGVPRSKASQRLSLEIVGCCAIPMLTMPLRLKALLLFRAEPERIPIA